MEWLKKKADQAKEAIAAPPATSKQPMPAVAASKSAAPPKKLEDANPADLAALSKDDLIAMLMAAKAEKAEKAKQPEIPDVSDAPAAEAPPVRDEAWFNAPIGQLPDDSKDKAGPDDPPPPPALTEMSEVKKQIEAIANNSVSAWNNPGAVLKFNDMEKEMGDDLAAALRQNTSLQICGLQAMELDDSAMACLFVPGETKLSRVQYLVLYRNAITDVGLGTLVSAIMEGALENIEVLGLANNQITLASNGSKHPLVDAIEKHKMFNLRQIYLAGNPLDDAGTEALKKACEFRKVVLYTPVNKLPLKDFKE